MNLQELSNDMQCLICGPTPEDTIWDGVYLSFHQKHMLGTLWPPTRTHENSLIRQARYVSRQQILLDPPKSLEQPLRKLIRTIVKGPFTAPTRPASDTDKKSEAAVEAFLGRIKSIPDACTRLAEIDKSLGDLFAQWFGVAESLTKPPDEYIEFFSQVSPVIP